VVGGFRQTRDERFVPHLNLGGEEKRKVNRLGGVAVALARLTPKVSVGRDVRNLYSANSHSNRAEQSW
jgi:hypothetical protein|tara:strand:- start:696 stop:899 length:204 start_codon:yes stop_codon:yes gene_type:complete